jgi:hypothetical protein
VDYRSPRRYTSIEEKYQVAGGASSSRQELPASGVRVGPHEGTVTTYDLVRAHGETPGMMRTR